ncbi:DNA-directed RNA polymerase subunit omega [Wohlfahrtiimonas populi]|jgi:DNA-directed RNA polymerase subunit omega|uniref:DNA-directed RNA polymerase subunit omega n=1 Tax=Wohlfahrtiimonas populi TaxID=1940240 RepID=UPI00098D5C56|nr:DNA-directed RNA polymerase subunit omega [Wohlfahrtiimonas populi]
MARVTVEDCLDKVDNRFQLVLLASRRAHQLALGADTKLAPNGEKVTVMALREIAEELITIDEIKKLNVKPKPVIVESFKPETAFEF